MRHARYDVLQWVFFQMAAVGPMFGQLGFFHKFAGREYDDKRPLQRYVDETKRLLGVMDAHLDGRTWFADDYSIADVSHVGWVRNLSASTARANSSATTRSGIVDAWLQRCLARPAVQRGLDIPKRPAA